MSVRKGEVVTIYMPMIPETVYCMLGCARIGAVANLVFSGFSSSALATRLQSTRSRVLLTADRLNRGNRLVELMPVVKDALLVCPHVEYCVVYQNSDQSVPRDGLEIADQLTCQSHSSALSDLSNSMAGIVQNFHHLIFYDFTEWMGKERMYCPCEWMDSEDPLFVLYTSGSTGKPKGMIHTTGGYLVYASLTHKYLFKVREDDVYACMTDLGWITGHTYVVWGPLLNGTTTCMFESTPLYPNPCRYWDFVQRYKVNIFYTAPTAIRALMKYGESEVSKYDLSTLRVLGTVGEPISPSAWEWYYRVVGKGKCSIVDSYWMTESGGILLAPIPGVTPMKPGSCCLPFFGIKPALIDPNTGDELTSKGIKGVMCVSKPWPSMARGMHGDYKRFVCTYFEPYRRHFFTGDGAYLDKDGYFWITGRLDDVINVSGHRLSTAEIEASLASHGTCTDVAVIGIPHDIKGQSICAFCVPKRGYEFQENLTFELCQHVRRTIASMAMPDKLYLVPALPKTRSGKVMRRLLRKIAAFEFDSLGDISTLAEAEVIDQIISVVRRQGGHK
ncbi:acetyl-coenzyme A synthetase-like isoform X2 [Schistocerca gregaria]|nr:acetyl-coenzyme A synthetase-like isoform X2 [Schistocerca gregaria]